jgi:large subunit ribosomal protein L10e
MALRPAKCYRKLGKPYTRQSRKMPRKGYVKGVPLPKITRFEFGNRKKNFSLKTYLVSEQNMQIRHNALEAARIAAHRVLSDSLGDEGYFMKILVFPHHIMRENPLSTGAGADRFQTGMRKAFGKPIGTAVRVKRKQRIIEIRVDKNGGDVAKKALKIADSKLPAVCRIEQIK